MNKDRQFDILLGLANDFISFLELFEDEETIRRKKQVENIVERIEKGLLDNVE